jgi:uncharacterized protein YbjT (DUF2867 family)
MVLVAGATGMVGGEVCRRLKAAGAKVRALARESSAAEKVSALQAAGIEVARGDLRNRASLDAAARGVEAVVSTVSAMPFSWSPDNTIGEVDVGGQRNLIDAARAAGARRFVYVSFPDDPEVSFGLGNAKRATEKHLRSSGMEYTSLWANYFMEVWLTPAFGFDYAGGKAAVFGEGSNPISWVSYVDVARNAVAALSSDAGRNSILPVGGSQALSPLEVVAVFERQGGAKWNVDRVPVEALRSQKAAAQDEVSEAVAALQIMYATSKMAMSPDSYLVQDGLRSVADYARSVLVATAAGA